MRKLLPVLPSLAAAESDSAQCAAMLLPTLFGIHTIGFPLWPIGALVLSSAAIWPVIFKPDATSIFIATPPAANFSASIAFAATFFLPAETTNAYLLPFG